MFRVIVKNVIHKFDSLPEAVNYRHKNGGTLYQKIWTTE